MGVAPRRESVLNSFYGHTVRFYVGVTDRDWFDYLARIDGLDKVNFWQPSGNCADGRGDASEGRSLSKRAKSED
jgi:putative restriction endonuclease